MSDELYQSLSAIMDDEADEAELETILSLIGSDAAMRDKWLELNRARDLLHGIPVKDNQPDVSCKIKDLIEHEISNSKVNGGNSFTEFMNPIISFAVAASVAAIVVIGGQVFLNSDEEFETQYAGGISPISMTPIAGSSPRHASYSAGQGQQLLFPEANLGNQRVAYEQLRIHGLEHAASLAPHTPLGKLSFVRVPVE